MSLEHVVKDDYGVRLKFPNRSCKQCSKYPCFPEITKTVSNFAAYGCIYYKDYNNKDKNGCVS